jgi:type IV pilus assembly protein PilC
MAEFVVKIADERGNVHQHVEQGYSEAEVRDRFLQQGYHVYWIKPQGLMTGGMRKRRKLKQATFLVFNQQFLTLIRAGMPILQALELLIKRQKDPQLKQILENVRDRVKGGELLSDAFAAQGVIPKIYTTTLLAGEKSGAIDEVLTRYIGFQRMAMTFRKKLFV